MVAQADPRAYVDELKTLFVEHERPEFPAFYDRAYAAFLEDGAQGWRGTAPDGQLVMHIARFSHRFSRAGEVLDGGLLGNLMVAKEHRQFFPALSLVRRVIRDSRESGTIDLLFGDPREQAEGLFKAAGFQLVGQVERYTLVIGDRHLPLDLGVRMVRRLRHAPLGVRGAATVRPARDADATPYVKPDGGGQRLVAWRPAHLFTSRLEGFPSAEDHWCLWHEQAGAAGPADAALLVRRTEWAGYFQLASLRRRTGVELGTLIPAVTPALHALGCRRLSIWTLRESAFAAELQRVGFVARQEPMPMYALGLTERGRAAVAAPADWEVTQLDCDR